MNSRYVRQGEYNKTRKLYRAGTKVREERPTAEHITYDTPTLIERDLWDAVTARFDSNEGFRATQGNATRGPAPKYLLTGLARCGCCGGPIMVGRRKQGRENINVYSCGWRRDRGAALCSNNAVAPVVEVDAAVIEGVRRYITPEVASEVLRQVRAILKERTAAAPDETARQAGEVSKLKQEAARDLRAIGATDDPPDMLVEALADANKRLRLAESQLAAVESMSTVLDAELENLEREVHQRLANLHAEFATSPNAAKDVLKMLTGQERLKFAPDNREASRRGADRRARASRLRHRRFQTGWRPQGGLRHFEISFPAEIVHSERGGVNPLSGGGAHTSTAISSVSRPKTWRQPLFETARGSGRIPNKPRRVGRSHSQPDDG